MDLDGLNRRLLVVFLALSFFICHSCDIWRAGFVDYQRQLCFETGVGRVSISLDDFGRTWLTVDCEGEYLIYPDSIKISRIGKSKEFSIEYIQRDNFLTGAIEKEPFIVNNELILIILPIYGFFGNYNFEADLTDFIKDINGNKVFNKPFTLTF